MEAVIIYLTLWFLLNTVVLYAYTLGGISRLRAE